jgi:glycosyltransferase involved in cell wall biosynthesis
MRILHVVPTYLPATRYGGPIYSVHGLAKAQAALGARVDVLTTNVDGPFDSDVPLGVPVERDGVRVFYFASQFGRRIYYSRSLAMWLKQHIGNYDLLHLHSVFLYPTNVAARIAKRAGVPFWLAPRGMLVPELIQAKNALIKRLWLALVEGFTLREAAALHFTSELERADAQRLAIDTARSFVLPNGVDECTLDEKRDERCWIYLGRLNPKKNLMNLLTAFALVREDFPGLRLELVGPDENNYAQLLAQRIEELGIRDCVHLAGEVRGEAKWTALASAGLKLLVSVNENFGNAAAEAMMVGTPVLLSEGVGLSEWLREGPASVGWTCGTTVESIAHTMREIAKDPAQRAARGLAAAALAHSQFSWRAIAQKSLQLAQVAL